MRLSENNFSKRTCLSGKPSGDKKEVVVYTYETGRAIYDVCIFNGRKYYQKNMRGYTYDQEAIHKAIEKHFNV